MKSAAWLAALLALPLDGAKYVEPLLCARCHAAIAESYALTGMARSFAAVRPGTHLAGLEKSRFRHEASQEFFSVSTRDEKPVLRRYQVGFEGKVANVFETNIDYWFGSGDHARGYISRDSSGSLIELPIAWYAENGGYWSMSPGFDSAQHSGFSRKITDRCMFCHTAYTERSREGIDCQRCHGPGGDHVEAVRQKSGIAAIRNAIVNPARLTSERRIEVCLQCHLETTTLRLPGSLVRYGRGVFSYQPGEPLGAYALYFDHAPGKGHDDKFEFVSAAYRLFKSACYRASRDSLTCTTCHNPHQQASMGEDTSARYAGICRNCHAARISELAAKRRHTASGDCVSCHMLKRRPSDAIHVTITDHYIRRAPKPDPGRLPVEQNSSNTPPYRGEVKLYYPRQSNGDAELYLAVAQVKNQANLKDGIAGLEKAIRRFKPARAEFYLDLADAYRNAGDMTAAAAMYREACVRDPKQGAAFHGLGLALAAKGDLSGSLSALKRAQSLAPVETTVLESLAGVLVQLERVQDAVAMLRSGLTANPHSADLHNNLGTALLRLGDRMGAESELREAVRLRPELAAMHLNLGSLLSRGSGFAEAKYEFEQAIRIDPASAEAHSAYGTALAAHSNWGEARGQFQAAIRLNPGLPNSHNNLGTVYRQMGEHENAIREYRIAIEIQPGFATAHYNLAIALAAQGERDAAEQQLEDAIRYQPNYPEAHLKLGQMLVERGRGDLAAEHLRKAR